jgi:outer membrane lipoprotein SlyB
MTARTLRFALLIPVLLAGCVVASSETRTWSADSGGEWARYGQVETIRETVNRTEGNPAGGAMAGAVIGGLLGTAMSGGRPEGTFAGAVGGAMVGASASQGAAENRTYELFVRFQDGALERFVYAGAPPFQVGEWVAQTPRGLQRY